MMDTPQEPPKSAQEVFNEIQGRELQTARMYNRKSYKEKVARAQARAEKEAEQQRIKEEYKGIKRVVSGFPLSIGTALAFESLFPPRQEVYDKERAIPNKINISEYTHLYINLSTLIRNIFGACEHGAEFTLPVSQITDTLYNEIQTIIDLLNNEGGGTCTPIFYVCSYKRLETSLTNKPILIRVPKTEKQRNEFIKTQATIKELYKTFKDIQLWDSELLPVKNALSVLLITHHPYDLVSVKNFKKLDLLESHTGVLKTKLAWWTKYYKIPEPQTEDNKQSSMSVLPFTRKLLLVLGDNSLIRPSDSRLRKQILEIALKRKWNPLTTEDKVLFDLNLDLPDKFLVELIRSL